MSIRSAPVRRKGEERASDDGTRVKSVRGLLVPPSQTHMLLGSSPPRPSPIWVSLFTLLTPRRLMTRKAEKERSAICTDLSALAPLNPPLDRLHTHTLPLRPLGPIARTSVVRIRPLIIFLVPTNVRTEQGLSLAIGRALAAESGGRSGRGRRDGDDGTTAARETGQGSVAPAGEERARGSVGGRCHRRSRMGVAGRDGERWGEDEWVGV